MIGLRRRAGQTLVVVPSVDMEALRDIHACRTINFEENVFETQPNLATQSTTAHPTRTPGTVGASKREPTPTWALLPPRLEPLLLLWLWLLWMERLEAALRSPPPVVDEARLLASPVDRAASPLSLPSLSLPPSARASSSSSCIAIDFSWYVGGDQPTTNVPRNEGRCADAEVET